MYGGWISKEQYRLASVDDGLVYFSLFFSRFRPSCCFVLVGKQKVLLKQELWHFTVDAIYVRTMGQDLGPWEVNRRNLGNRYVYVQGVTYPLHCAKLSALYLKKNG